MRETERTVQREERRGKTAKSRYNRWYLTIKGEGVPGYLKKVLGESKWQRMAR